MRKSSLRHMRKKCKRCKRKQKLYLDSMRAMVQAQGRIAETIDVFYGAADRTSEGAMAASAYKRSVDELEAATTREFDAPYRTCILEPLGRMNAYFPVINDTITKRNKKMLDYDATRNKVRKLTDKPSEDATRLPKAQQEHDDAKEVFDYMNKVLIEELPQLLDLRIPFFDPSFESMIRMQCKFAEEGYEKMGGVQRYFQEHVRDDYAAGQLDSQVEGVLNEMKELTICSTLPT